MPTQIRWRNPLGFSFIFLFALYACALTQNQTGEVEAHSQSDDSFRVRVDVDLVTTDITVIGNVVPKFKKEDFVVYDNRVAQDLIYFSQDQLPIAVAILIDTSTSIIGHLNELEIAALTALRRLKQEDQVALYSFAGTCNRLGDLTEDRFQIAKLLSNLEISSGGTDIYDTLRDATRYLKEKAPRRRRAIILISDNCHNVGGSAESSRTELLESSTTLYSIVTVTPGSSYCESKSRIRHIAEETGGEVFKVQGKMSVKAALEDTISRLRMQYTLGFNSSDRGRDGQFHSLIVRFADEKRCKNCRIIGRKGYYAGVAAPLLLPEETRTKPRSSSDNIDELMAQRSILIAGTTFPDLREIPFKLSAAVQTDANGIQLHLDLVIDSGGLSFVEIGSQLSYKALAAVVRADDNGKLVDTYVWKITDQLSNESYQHIRETGIPFSATIPLTVPNQNLRVVLYDENSDRIASRLVQIHNYKNVEEGRH